TLYRQPDVLQDAVAKTSRGAARRPQHQRGARRLGHQKGESLDSVPPLLVPLGIAGASIRSVANTLTDFYAADLFGRSFCGPSGTLLSNQAQIRDSRWLSRQRGQEIDVFVPRQAFEAGPIDFDAGGNVLPGGRAHED